MDDPVQSPSSAFIGSQGRYIAALLLGVVIGVMGTYFIIAPDRRAEAPDRRAEDLFSKAQECEKYKNELVANLKKSTINSDYSKEYHRYYLEEIFYSPTENTCVASVLSCHSDIGGGQSVARDLRDLLTSRNIWSGYATLTHGEFSISEESPEELEQAQVELEADYRNKIGELTGDMTRSTAEPDSFPYFICY